MSKKLSVITISITPFDAAGRLDEDAFRGHVRRLRDGGVSVFVGGSGSGEGYALKPEENDRILAIAVEELKGRVGVYADGVEPHATQDMVDFVRRVENSGVDAVRIMPVDIGHGARPTPAEIERYHARVIEATSSPILLTSHELSGYVLPLDLIEKLVDRYPTIRGINYGGSDLIYLASLIKRVGQRIDVHCAGSINGVATLALGGNGFMGNEGNIAPALAQSVITAFQARDMERLAAVSGKLLALAQIVKRYGGHTLRGVKPLLNAFGLPGGTLREPRLPITGVELDRMISEVLALEIAELPPLLNRA